MLTTACSLVVWNINCSVPWYASITSGARHSTGRGALSTSRYTTLQVTWSAIIPVCPAITALPRHYIPMPTDDSLLYILFMPIYIHNLSSVYTQLATKSASYHCHQSRLQAQSDKNTWTRLPSSIVTGTDRDQQNSFSSTHLLLLSQLSAICCTLLTYTRLQETQRAGITIFGEKRYRVQNC